MSKNKNTAHRSPLTAHGPIPYGRQHITDEDIQAVVETLKSDYLTQGPRIPEFEEAFAEYVGAKYALAVANGTAALHLNCLALGVQPGDKVITSPITFAASANCVRYCGGEVVFADIDRETYLLDINEVRKLLEAAPKGTYKGIIPVDFAGRACDLQAFRELADEYGLWIIEDSCHSPGGHFVDRDGNAQRCGNGQFADLAIFSFHPVKHIAAGEGGMITTNDPELYEKLLMLRTHGITKDASKYKNPIELALGKVNSEQGTVNGGDQESADRSPLTAHSSPPPAHRSPLTAYPQWYMEMQTLGYNYRLTDFQAALGLSQLQRADVGLQRRREIAAVYYEAFKDISQITDRNYESVNSEQSTASSRSPLTAHRSPLTAHRSPSSHAYHLYVIEAEDRLGLYNYLREQQIYAQIHYIPCHLMPYYQEQGWIPGNMEQAEAYYSQCISLPMYPTLTEEEQLRVIEKVNSFYR
jgi:dTDP-4-amino-4,6-dideoxygalactose transaminase